MTFRIFPAVAALTLATAAYAHHGWSSYDTAKAVQLTGTFTTLNWANPHGTAKMVWQGKEWDVILAPVSRMEARGLSREMVVPGKEFSLYAYPRSDGTAEMRVERVMVEGKTVELR